MEKPTKGIAVDSSYSSSTGFLEWRVVDIETGNELYRNALYSSSLWVNNIGEFFGIVRGIKWIIENESDLDLFSDSNTAIKWAMNQKVSTSVENEKLLKLVEAGVNYLKTIHPVLFPTIIKWDTKAFGNIPADFNRK